MGVLKAQLADSYTQDVYAANEPQVGNMSGKSVVIVDESRANRKGFVAGMGPNMFNGMFGGIFLVGGIAASIFAAIAVGLATGDIKPALKTLGIGVGSSVAVRLFIHIVDPKF